MHVFLRSGISVSKFYTFKLLQQYPCCAFKGYTGLNYQDCMRLPISLWVDILLGERNR